MKNQFPPLRLHPEPWVGMSVPYSPDWTKNVFLTAITTAAFDRISKTWWFPRSFEPVVSQMIREKFSDIKEEALSKARVSLYRDRVNIPGESSASDFAILGLAPSAPPQLVDWALSYWKQVYAYYGAPTTKLLEVEEAYERIMKRFVNAAPPAAVSGQPREDQG